MTAVIALGANLGDRPATLQAALDELAAAGMHIVAVSRLYETDPVGGPEQPAYLNAVAIIAGEPAPDALLDLLHRIEQAHGRTREVRWGARTLDLDIVAVDAHGGAVISDDPRLTLPHPRAHERAFVLVPWLDADPDAVLVTADGGRRRVAELVEEIGQGGVRLTDGALRPRDARPTVEP